LLEPLEDRSIRRDPVGELLRFQQFGIDALADSTQREQRVQAFGAEKVAWVIDRRLRAQGALLLEI
jgi:hypothetical protein